MRKLVDPITNQEYRVCDGCFPSSQLIVEAIPKTKTFSWDDVADGVLVYREGYHHFYLRRCASFLSLRLSDQWNVWRGGKCPLPEGVRFEVEYRSGCEWPASRLCESSWEKLGDGSDIIAYRVTGLSEGYVYPDQMDGDNGA